MWMSDKRGIPQTPGDVSVRIGLMYNVHGLNQVEEYFNALSQNFKGVEVYSALLNCYCKEQSVEKAESIMQKIRDMGVADPLSYNILMNLYSHIGNWEKLDILMNEMKEKGISWDSYTLSIRLSAYAAASDTEGIEKIVERMKSDPNIKVSFADYSVAANGYFKVGLVDKALEMLTEMEKCVRALKKNNVGFYSLLKLYAKAGKKNEVYRIWYLYKEEGKLLNQGYLSMMNALSMFNDVDGAEKIFEEWENSGLSCDFRVPNCLILAYCRNGELEKAEAVLNREIGKGGIPSLNTWGYLAGGYIAGKQVPKAVDALKKAIKESRPDWKPSKETLLTYLKNLENPLPEEQAVDMLKVLWA